MHVCTLELLLEVLDLTLLVIHDLKLGINVLGRQVRDLRGATCVVESAQILFEVFVRGREACDLITTQTQ